MNVLIVYHVILFDPIELSRYTVTSSDNSDDFTVSSSFYTPTLFSLLNCVDDKVPPE